MNKAGILVAMSILVGGSILEQRAAGRQWSDIFIHGADRQWLAVVILLAVFLTMDDLGAGDAALALSLLIATGYILGGAGALGPAIQSVVYSEWGVSTTSAIGGPTSGR